MSRKSYIDDPITFHESEELIFTCQDTKRWERKKNGELRNDIIKAYFFIFYVIEKWWSDHSTDGEHSVANSTLFFWHWDHERRKTLGLYDDQCNLLMEKTV